MGNSLRHVVFQNFPSSYKDNPNLIWLETRQKTKIPAFFFYRGKEKLTILFSHGNAEDLGMIVRYFEQMAQVWDVNFMAHEYTGYGPSTGTASEANVYGDVDAAYKYLVETCHILPSSIIAYGRSLGSCAAVDVAYHHRIGGVILHSALTSVLRVVFKLVKTIPGDMFPNIDKIKHIACPVFVIHGVNDEIVPFSHGVELYNNALFAVSPYWLSAAGHNDIIQKGGAEYILNIRRFIQYVAQLNEDPSELHSLQRSSRAVISLPLTATALKGLF